MSTGVSYQIENVALFAVFCCLGGAAFSLGWHLVAWLFA